ncbi:MAG: glycosyltransferase [Planctomycetes bacterium]|nr:glycosyltransferase [Planctomycetota bacterium]
MRRILRVIADEGIEVLYSTFSPASNHLLAMRVRAATGLPWVADFRDLWTDDYRYREAHAPLRSAHHRLEQEFLEAADMVIGVSGRQMNILASHVPGHLDKFVTITNGFDPEDFDGCSDHESVARNGDGFVLAHVGRFDRWRTPDVFFDGLSRFVRDTEAAGHSFELRIVGHIDRLTALRIDATGVTWSGTSEVSHREAIGEMCRADALILNVPDGPNADSVIPAKVFEYLAARRPIVVVGPIDREAERIVLSQRAGMATNFDERDIGRAIGRLFGAWRGGRLAELYDPCDIDPFSRVALTKQLAESLDHLATRATEKRDPQTALLETTKS